MWAYIVRRILYNIPVYLGIVVLVMVALRVNDPVYAFLGKNASAAEIAATKENMGLNDPYPKQFLTVFDFSVRSWEQKIPVGEMLVRSIPTSMAIAVPTLILTALVSIVVGIIAAYYRGRITDRVLMLLAVVGMSISYLVYIILGQYFLAYLPSREGWFDLFAVAADASVGDDAWFFFRPDNWARFCLLPVLIGVVVAVGYDTRFYRAVMVEESGKDYITTAFAKGAGKRKVMFVHLLKNAMIPIITLIMTSLPTVVIGSILLEVYFNVPGMGRTLIRAINAKDFPVTQSFVAVFAAIFILTNILTDVLYALVDPRVRLS